MQVSRRKFFKICAGGMAGTSAAMLGFAPANVLAAPREYKLLRAFESHNTCTYCAVSCGMLLYSTGKPYNSLSSHTGTNTRSKLFHIEGDPDHPVSRGALCPKGAGALDYVNSESRSLYPQYRAPGSDKWERISWKDAIKRIARLMKDDRDANFVEKDASGKTVNRWATTGIMTASAMSNEAALLTQKWIRMLGMVPVCNQANT
ncbi:sulfate ABC transporter substrate-binding protein [Haemophilus influenzae]|nr:sulfate ABC transporter substrate-binding protein [Haemophilus influenzae]